MERDRGNKSDHQKEVSNELTVTLNYILSNRKTGEKFPFFINMTENMLSLT